MDMSDSEEDEYNNAGVVYDSENSDEEFNSDDDDAVRYNLLLNKKILLCLNERCRLYNRENSKQ